MKRRSSILLSSWRLFSFLNFMKMWPNLTKTILREASRWHLRSKIRKLTGKSGLKVCKLILWVIKLFKKFLKYKPNRKMWKVLNSEKVDWQNLSEQFPHLSRTNFVIWFSSENFGRENGNFKNCNFFGQAYFLHSGNQVFTYHT